MKSYLLAQKYLGLKETIDRKQLQDLFAKAGFKVNPDGSMPNGVPWCAYFVNTMEVLAGHTGTRQGNARSFVNYGEYVDPRDAQEGDIVIFKRPPNPYQGHVAFFVKELPNGYMRILGGNQSDMVCYENHKVDTLLAVRRSSP